ncbi:inosine/xanthosine triphosphatase [Martelella alba]|uniref:Inosine/xanthosine triphosphatase n=1 Tax=Martelella alba TaxID=2590451 RepID=A0ABY2SS33_9HYPH|nr:inosine/xanthosine triphosphatase [Martelella alba]TKI08695.1 non-canonical purine NTP phosphatase [Martelella alba]
MYLIAAATTNPAKIDAILQAFIDTFGPDSCRVDGIVVDSGVPPQPIGNAETRLGARNRAAAARQACPEADFWVGVEAGIEDNMTFAWMVIENAQIRGESRSAGLILPESLLQGITAGRELGQEMARLTGIEDIKRRGGAIGVFTHGLLTRSSVYYQALVLALAPFHNNIYHRR